LYDGITKLSSDEPFGIEDSVDGVFGGLVLGSITDKSFSFSEANIGWGGSVTLVVGDDLDSFVLPDADTGVGGSKINADGFALRFF